MSSRVLPKGTCDVCGKTVALDENGKIRIHGQIRLYGVLMGDGCKGTGRLPADDDSS